MKARVHLNIVSALSMAAFMMGTASIGSVFWMHKQIHKPRQAVAFTHPLNAEPGQGATRDNSGKPKDSKKDAVPLKLKPGTAFVEVKGFWEDAPLVRFKYLAERINSKHFSLELIEVIIGGCTTGACRITKESDPALYQFWLGRMVEYLLHLSAKRAESRAA